MKAWPKPQFIHISEVGEVTKEDMESMESTPHNPTLKFYHCSTERDKELTNSASEEAPWNTES